jgi:hypothetical protein
MIHTSTLSRHYDTLKPRERLPLIVAACLRGDEAEVELLTRSAPRQVWEMPDYYWLADKLREQAAQYLLEQLSAAALLWEAMYLLAQSKGLTAENQRGTVPDWMRLSAYVVVARSEGWKLFCADLPLDAEAFLGILPGYEAVRRVEKAATAFAFTREQAEAYLLEYVEPDDDASAVDERRVSMDGPAEIAAAMRESLEERLQHGTQER